MSTKPKPFADGCPFHPRGVVCRDEPKDCARCGWFPAEAKRRKLERIAGENGGDGGPLDRGILP